LKYGVVAVVAQLCQMALVEVLDRVVAAAHILEKL